ncbi:hypothetical protein Tco_1214182 [Tanacetum coccineum]
MVSYSKKMMEVFIRGLPRSIEGNVIASKPQTLEEAISIAQRLMDQVTEERKLMWQSSGVLTGGSLKECCGAVERDGKAVERWWWGSKAVVVKQSSGGGGVVEQW